MALVTGQPLTITDSSPQRIDADETDFKSGTNLGTAKFGRVVDYYADAPHHRGPNNNVRPSDDDTSGPHYRGAKFPAGFYSKALQPGEELWIVATTGSSVTVEHDTTGA